MEAEAAALLGKYIGAGLAAIALAGAGAVARAKVRALGEAWSGGMAAGGFS